MTEVIMPKMGDGMEEGTLLEWLKNDGDKVKTGEIIGNIQTDKATLELESPGSGVLSGILIKPGETVPVGRPIAALLKEGEKLPGTWGTGDHKSEAKAEAPAAEAPAAEAAPEAPAAKKEEKVQEPAAVGASANSSGANAAAPTAKPGSDERVKASPLAKKVAEELGVDLSSVQGSGPGGRITEKDVRSAPAETPGTAVVSAPSGQPVVADTLVPLNRLRQITAQRTQQSKQTAPHFYVTLEVDIEAIHAMRDQFEAEGSGKVSVNDFVVKACARALVDMPIVNSSFQDTNRLQYGSVNIGVAAAVEDGLLVPVIKNCESLSLRQISAETKRLVGKAREGKLHPDEMSGSTFSISNMGMLNVDVFSAIINMPNAAILAIGTARRKVVVMNDEDELEVRWRMNITASFDHRVVDGAVGAQFINVVKDYLENPTRLLG